MTTQTPVTTEKVNAYTEGAWQGKLYNRDLTIKEIADYVRFFVKKQYPKVKLSVTTERYSGGQAIRVALMSAPFEVFAKPDIAKVSRQRYGTDEEKMVWWQKAIEKGHHDVNQYHFMTDEYLTDDAKAFFQFVIRATQAYNYDDSDSMIDYFDTNFYSHFAIGKWDKAFTLTK